MSESISLEITGLRSDIPTQTRLCGFVHPFEELSEDSQLDEVFSKVEGGLVGLAPMGTSSLWAAAIHDQVFILHDVKSGSIARAADRHNVRFVVQDVFRTKLYPQDQNVTEEIFCVKKALLDAGITKDVESLQLQENVLAQKATPPEPDTPLTEMVHKYQHNRQALEAASSQAWYEKLRAVQILAAAPGFNIDRGIYGQWAVMLQDDQAKQGMVTAWISNLEDFGTRWLSELVPNGTFTGRFTSRSPNMHGVPHELRKAFFAPNNLLLISGDYHQAQPRILYALSHDEEFGRSFYEGLDFYKCVASAMFGKAYEDVTDGDRKIAKVIGLGIPYGMGLSSFIGKLQQAGCIVDDPDQAQNLLDSFWRKYSTLDKWRKRLNKGLEYTPKVPEGNPRCMVTPSGRVLRYAEAGSYQGGKLPYLAHMAQAVEVEIVVDAMARFAEQVVQQRLSSTGLQHCIHDEILIYTSAEEATQAQRLLRECMEEAFKSYTPLPELATMTGIAEISKASNCWGDIK